VADELAWPSTICRGVFDIPPVCGRHGDLYVFDTAFDSDIDEYSDEFAVYRLNPETCS
jgi:hypothetical protein